MASELFIGLHGSEDPTKRLFPSSWLLAQSMPATRPPSS